MVEQIGKLRGAAYEIRVCDLFTPQAKVFAVCLACEHKVEMFWKPLFRWGHLEKLVNMEDKLRCRKCKNRGFCTFRIEWMD